MRHFIGGRQKLMPELLAMVAPTVNSVYAADSWFLGADGFDGVVSENRTLRVARHSWPREVATRRVSSRSGGCESIHHSSRGARLGGCRAVEHRIEPEPLVEGNAYDHKFPEHLALPRTLQDAAQR